MILYILKQLHKILTFEKIWTVLNTLWILNCIFYAVVVQLKKWQNTIVVTSKRDWKFQNKIIIWKFECHQYN